MFGVMALITAIVGALYYAPMIKTKGKNHYLIVTISSCAVVGAALALILAPENILAAIVAFVVMGAIASLIKANTNKA
jgi:hypothetical protein